ncbi:MAG: phosphatase PAP2 family protein [Novosphingobium sp.]
MSVRFLGAACGLAAITAASTAFSDTTAPVPADEARRAAAAFLASGYLGRDRVPDSLLINPPPPERGTVAAIRDEEAAGSAVALRNTPRWEQARIDADLFSPAATGTFSCAAGFTISAETTPKLNALLRRMAADLAAGSYPTKQRYKRDRPFVVNGEATCTPQDEPMLRQDGSYPSGHSAIGYGWGLLLAEVVPDRAAQLVSRGRAFGDSRRVCNVHWLSDVEEGRMVAAAVVARLHAEPAFQGDLKKARAEVTKARRKLAAPDCAREQAALAGA